MHICKTQKKKKILWNSERTMNQIKALVTFFLYCVEKHMIIFKNRQKIVHKT